MGVITQRTKRVYIGADADKASIPAAAKAAGDEFIATDTGYKYQWSGAAWVWPVPDASIVEAKIGPLAVTGGKLAAGAVSRAKIASGVAAWDIVHDVILGAPAASILISGLLGNTAEEYLLIGRVVSAFAGSVAVLRFNGDSGANYDYASHIFGAGHISMTDAGVTQLRICIPDGSGDISAFFAHIYARSGYYRTVISQSVRQTSIYGDQHYGRWTNTADEVTSITILEAAANNLGAGTHITLLKKSQVSS